MYIVNTTFVVEPAAQDRWLGILKEKYIPLLLQEGFHALTFTRVLTEGGEAHHTYSLQVGVAGIPEYQRLAGPLFDAYREAAEPLFGAQVLHFTTLMKKIDL